MGDHHLLSLMRSGRKNLQFIVCSQRRQKIKKWTADIVVKADVGMRNVTEYTQEQQIGRNIALLLMMYYQI